MRGSPLATQIAVMPSGIIPAHAGLTPRGPSSAVAPRDHPRACGAHTEVSDMKKQYEGSSPRMRGSLRLVSSYRSPSGIIPAHAGLTTVASFFSGPAKDHPRACGAHFTRAILVDSMVGSSPRMRGSRKLMEIPLIDHGIIPAHAGLTVTSLRRTPGTGDHPRACGAHDLMSDESIVFMGSSPRMRGSLIRCIIVVRIAGIIPAHAGLTPRWRLCCQNLGDHPRACGAHAAEAGCSS